MKNNSLTVLLVLLTACAPPPAETVSAQFVDVTDESGLRSEATWKYGGPTLADLDNDGRHDLILTNHHEVPAQLFFATDDNRFAESGPVMRWDVHGIAAGDYDADGLVDLVVSLGGGNGTSPQPPRLLRNTGGGFEDVTAAAGIAELGARGRSVRWIDLDTDGDLDLLEIVAQQLPGETGPRNILFENVGDGRFEYRESPAFEDIEAERVLITDIDNDHVPDLVTFTPLRIMKGDDDFGFTDVSEQWLAGIADEQREHTMAVSEADIDNDGDMDLYVARGKTYYEIANNSVELDENGRMNLRDEGNEGQDAINFTADYEVGLLDFWHWPRGVDLTLPVYLGEAVTAIETPKNEVRVSSVDAAGFPESMDENGWYLGYLGNSGWRLGWNLNGNLAWDVRASVTGVQAISPAWTPQALGVQDLLLINEGDHFRDGTFMLPAESRDNNWGVITGDFDNDADADFFVYRFGQLHGRIEDVLLNNADGVFESTLDHGASKIEDGGHGDMGAPIDYDQDGWLDILSGSDNYGYWHLYRNMTVSNNGSIAIRVGNSPDGVDPHGAEITLTSTAGSQFKRVGSAGAVHSQGLNNLVHFGLGSDEGADTVRVRWRDGSQIVIENVAAGAIQEVGTFAPPRTGRFDPRKDLFLPQFDSKTDVDDIHSIAGVTTVLRDPRLAGVRYHAVAGAYGKQEGLFVPSPKLFEQAFGDNWSDAHSAREQAVADIARLAGETIAAGGRVWVAEAGQSDFTADWVGRLVADGIDTKTYVHVVQHSDWNESAATPVKLAFVKANTTYHRIADGNFPDNGTPDFYLESGDLWDKVVANVRTGDIWSLAREIANRYNGVDGRYLNPAIDDGGMDFSDVSETCWIFGCDDLEDGDAFFRRFLPER